MCGIAGVVDIDVPDPEDLAGRMVTALRHRGPDDSGSWIGQRVILSMARLSVIDISGGHQPKRAGSWRVILNGEIYNYTELRRELEAAGQSFGSDSDTEVVARAIAEWDTNAFSRFDGMYALAAFDTSTRRLLLARDRYGEKPLYVWHRGGGIAFASEPKALRQVGPLPSLNSTSLTSYLHLGWVPGADSIWTSIERIPPGCHAVVKSGEFRLARTHAEVEADWDDSGDPVDALDRKLHAAVTSRLVADVEVGVLLSGGIDSSLVAAHAASVHPQIKTFSVAIDDPQRNEAAYARQVAAALGTDHHEIPVGDADALSVVGDLPTIFDEPFADSSAIPTLLVSRFAADHVKVALSGDGGDEVFSGYGRYARVAALRPSHRHWPRQAGSVVDRLSWSWWARPHTPLRRLAEERAPRESQYLDLLAVIPTRQLGRLSRRPPSLEGLHAEIRRLRATEAWNWPQRADTALYLPDDLLVKIDRASMSTGLEVRAPFLAPQVATWGLGLPPAAIGAPGTKALPRALLRRIFGDTLADRPKRGFSVPLARWLRGPLRDVADSVCDGVLVTEGWLDRPSVISLRRSLDRRFDRVAGPLWAMGMFEAWHERWMT